MASGDLYDLTAGTVGAGVTEQQLAQLIQAPLTNAAAAERQRAGFDATEVERMFRAGQFRQHILAARQLQPVPPAAALRNPAPLQMNGGQALQPHVADNIDALRLSESDVSSFLNNEFFEENRQGFATRALFWSPQGQVLRNLLTDDSGNKMGRFYISALWERTATRNLPAEQRVRITAYMHHEGTGTTVDQLVLQLADPQSVLMRNAYATAVVTRWRAMPVP
ncbi:MAG TPA: hypothetical protein VM759_01805 [Longimicrobium sp.]|nr:hypothetical protein [Longimicrobium sp.]